MGIRTRSIRRDYLRLATAAFVCGGVAGCATPSHMVVPSRATQTELEALTHKTRVVADVLTIDREEYELHLDGSGGGAFSGPGLGPGAAAIHVPLEQLALVYYRETPAGKPESPAHFVKETYPSLPAVGTAEQGLDCAALDLELARTGTIRWYARQSGALPFTEHEARVQHGKNAAKYVGYTMLTAVVLIGMAGGGGAAIGGGGSSRSSPAQIDTEAFRWALTAAQRRELGLLELKRDHACAPRAAPRGDTTDLQILAQVEGIRSALATQPLADQDEMRQESELLDGIDPPRTPRASTEELDAADNDKRAEALAGAVFASFDHGSLKEPKATDCSYSDFAPARFGSPFQIRERALVWLNSQTQQLESLPFSQIEEVRPLEKHYFRYLIPLRKANGSCVFLWMGGANSGSLESARSKLLECLARCPKGPGPVHDPPAP